MASLWKVLSILSLLIFLGICEICARPGIDQEYRQQIFAKKQCSPDPDVVEICQRCAKQTKSPIVYPMCCDNEEDVFVWCDQYINYGRKP